MTKSMLVRTLILTTAVTALAGCGSISSTLGLERHVPDETQVVVRPPLTLPPDYDLMPPGTPSAVSGDHEAGSSMSADGTPAAAPKKEERGFFGRVFHGDVFGNDVDATTAAPAQTPAPAADAPPAAAPPTDAATPAPATK